MIMFKLQEQILEVAGPLTCLWAHLHDSNEEPDVDQLKLVIQRALHGSSGKHITLHIIGEAESCLE